MLNFNLNPSISHVCGEGIQGVQKGAASGMNVLDNLLAEPETFITNMGI